MHLFAHTAYKMLLCKEAPHFYQRPKGPHDSLHPHQMFGITKLLSFGTVDIWGWMIGRVSSVGKTV